MGYTRSGSPSSDGWRCIENLLLFISSSPGVSNQFAVFLPPFTFLFWLPLVLSLGLTVVFRWEKQWKWVYVIVEKMKFAWPGCSLTLTYLPTWCTLRRLVTPHDAHASWAHACLLRMGRLGYMMAEGHYCLCWYIRASAQGPTVDCALQTCCMQMQRMQSKYSTSCSENKSWVRIL